ncbi:MAG TPA: hypothetical protein VN426_02920, partial [Syntrophomonadaceae bacterium]|nr:hypothetical protein [Syntrophomonadaceae bacterium]
MNTFITNWKSVNNEELSKLNSAFQSFANIDYNNSTNFGKSYTNCLTFLSDALYSKYTGVTLEMDNPEEHIAQFVQGSLDILAQSWNKFVDNLNTKQKQESYYVPASNRNIVDTKI